MRISVVIPAYNEAAYLPRTLESLKQQTRPPEEIIVVDGESSDETPAIARSFGAKVIPIKKTTIGAARQAGLIAAHGDIIAFTDADTVVPRDWLTKIQESMAKSGVVGTYGCYMVHDGWLPYRLFINLVVPLFFWLAPKFGVNIVGGQNLAFWKEKAIAVGGFPVDFRSAEDFEMMRRLSKIGRVVYRSDNPVISSGRRGSEGWKLFARVGRGFFRYFVTGKADTFTFPDIR